MPTRVGLLTEGHDHLILRAYLAKLLGLPEEELEPDVIDGTGHGWHFVERTIDRTLRRFYGQCARLAIVSMDNDGGLDLHSVGGDEDPRHPRHWLHAGQEPRQGCRWRSLQAAVEKTRPALNWLPGKPGDRWPIVIAVPVESIEAWLLATRAILVPGSGSLCAEQEGRGPLKHRLYGRPGAPREDVERIALPLIRQLTDDHIQVLKDHSRSFSDFAAQVGRHAEKVLTAPPCW
ncbi:MAG: hypothetical protein ACP5XB_02720 [Isosphaeraceae bacterium]